MSRAVPSYDTLDAIARAFDDRDRRSNRPIVPILSGPARPMPPSEVVARLRGIRDDLAEALKSGASWERDLAIVSMTRRITVLADDVERGA